MGPRSTATLTLRLLKQRKDELLGELRALAPEVVEKLEQTLEALTEQRPERGEYEGLDRPAVIRQYLSKIGRPVELREIRDAVAAPASRFNARSIWDGGKREVEQGRMLNIADGEQRRGLGALPSGVEAQSLEFLQRLEPHRQTAQENFTLVGWAAPRAACDSG